MLRTLAQGWDTDCSEFCFRDYAAELNLTRAQLKTELEPAAYASACAATRI